MGLMSLKGIMKQKTLGDEKDAPRVPSLLKKKPKVESSPMPSLMKRLTGK